MRESIEILGNTCKRIVTFGELMLRLAPDGYIRFVQADRLGMSFGGAEANVAVSLADYGYDVSFVSKLPEHEIGQAAVNSLRRYGVDTSFIVRGGDRVGIYYLEKGASQRASKVIYDRAASAIACAKKDEFDWNRVFGGIYDDGTSKMAEWFHLTGITPALSDETAEICLEACKAAKERGITISCDMNYRGKLWSKEKANKVMTGLCRYVDVCIANEKDLEDVFGIVIDDTDISAGRLSVDGYKNAVRKLVKLFPFGMVAITLRESISASDNGWSAVLYTGGEFYESKKYDIHIVDRVGGGDSFAAGLIAAQLEGYSPQWTVDTAVAASALKHSVEGDYNMVSWEEVEKLAMGDESGRVVR